MNLVCNIAERGILLVGGVLGGLLELGATGYGAVATLVSLATFGKFPMINSQAMYTNSARYIFQVPLEGIFQALKPHNYKYDRDSGFVHSFLTNKLPVNIFRVAQVRNKVWIDNQSWMRRHVMTRAKFAVGAVTFIIARIADFALGLLAAIGVIVCLGQNATLNNFVLKQAGILAVIDDIAIGLRGFENPTQFKG